MVIVRFDDGDWAAYFSTDITMTEREILETAADRWAIEESFQTVKESWELPAEELVDRNDRSSDNLDRHPSHADRQCRIMRRMLEN